MIEPLGTQLWADVRWRQGWRLQRRWKGGAARLVDPFGRVVYRAPLRECERALEQRVPEQVSAEHLVVLLHGLGRTRRSLARLDHTLENTGFVTARLDYPSTRATIEEHAAVVAELLDGVPTPSRLSLVGHSLGALIIRQLFRHEGPWRRRVHRVAMLAPPNQGASLACSLGRAGLLREILGPSFEQIAAGAPKRLPVPDVPCMVFAGDAVSGTGDGLVKVEETRLQGMSEQRVVAAIHTFIMNHPQVLSGVASFLGAAPDLR